LGEFHSMSSQSHVSHCRVLPLGEFIVMIPEPHATLQGVIIPSAISKIRFWPYFIYFCFFLNAVWSLTSGGFRIVSDTLVIYSWRSIAQRRIKITCVDAEDDERNLVIRLIQLYSP